LKLFRRKWKWNSKISKIIW